MRASLLYLIVLLKLVACGPAPKDVSPVAPPPTSTADPVQDTAAAYRAAITEYIRDLRKRDGSFPDTVFIGDHEEFPDIELPATIGQTSVRIVSPEEVEALKDDTHFAYLNIFGWITPGQVEFLVVNFKQGMRHWPDGRDDRHLRFTTGGGPNEVVLDSLWQ